MNKNNTRKTGSWVKSLLWIESKNKCPICENALIFPIDVFKEYDKDLEAQKIFKNWNKSQKKNKHIGVIAHNISHSNLVYPKKHSTSYFKKDIRSRKDYYKDFNNFINEKMPFKNYWNNGYKNEVIECFWNKIILCYKCSNNIDGKLLDTKKSFKNFFQGFHQMSPSEQIQKIINLKKEVYNKLNLKENLNNLKTNHVWKKQVISIKFSTIEEWYFASKSIEMLIGKNWKKTPILFNSDMYNREVEEEIEEFLKKIDGFQKLGDLIESDIKILNILPKNDNDLKTKSKEKIQSEVKIYKIELEFIGSMNDNYKCYFKLINDDSPLKDRKTFSLFSKLLVKKDGYNKAKNSDWISNSNIDHVKWEQKKEYQAFRNLLIKQLDDFRESREKLSNKKKFTSFSIAYMARWGTGKTTIVRKIAEDLKDLYNTIEINLWHISNSFSNNSNEYNEDHSFVRTIVKESITQLSNNPDLVEKYMDSSKRFEEFKNENDIKKKMLDSLLQFPTNTESETIFKERSKFLDQHISSLIRVTETIFKNTFKPTLFIFDDLDRIEDDKNIVSILDALVAFLNIPSAVYIIPLDEAKVMKAIGKVKVGKDPYSFMNKYFTYTIRAPFIPRINTLKILIESIESFKLNRIFNDKDLSHDPLLSKMAAVFPTTHRGIKDYLNAYQINSFILEDNTLVNDLSSSAKIGSKIFDDNLKKELIMLATILQINFPLLSNYLSNDMNRKEDLFKIWPSNRDEGILDIGNLLKFLKVEDETSKKDDTPPKLKVENSDFWSSLLNIDIPKKDYLNCLTLSKSITMSINAICNKNDIQLEEFKNLIITKLEALEKLLKTFELIGKPNSSYKLLFWTLFTLAEINDVKAIEFAKFSDIFGAFSINDSNDSLKYMKQITTKDKEVLSEQTKKSNIKRINSFLGKINEYNKLGFIDSIDYRVILNNLIKENYNFIKEITISDNDVINKLINLLADAADEEVISNFFKILVDPTRLKIIKNLNSANWMHEYQNEDGTKINKINKFMISILNFNRDILDLKINLIPENDKIKLDGKWKLDFIQNNNIFIFNDPIPLDINNYKENEELYWKLIKYLSILNKDINNNDIAKKIDPKWISNKELQKIEFQNINNIFLFINENKDFKDIDKYNAEIIQILFDKKYIENNIEDLLKCSIELFKKEVKKEKDEFQNKIILMNAKNITTKFINILSKMNSKSSLDIINKYKDILQKGEDKNSIIDIISLKISNKNKDNNILVELISLFDYENKLKWEYHNKIGFNTNLSYEGEYLYKSTPLMEIIKGILFIDKKEIIQINQATLVKKIENLNNINRNKLFNPPKKDTKQYTSIKTLFEYLREYDEYLYYNLPLEDTQISFDEAINNNNNEYIKLLSNNLSIKKVEIYYKKCLLNYRKKTIEKFLQKFWKLKNEYSERGHKYNDETFDFLEDSNMKNQKFAEMHKPLIKSWLGEQTSYSIEDINNQVKRAQNNKWNYINKEKQITTLEEVLEYFAINFNKSKLPDLNKNNFLLDKTKSDYINNTVNSLDGKFKNNLKRINLNILEQKKNYHKKKKYLNDNNIFYKSENEIISLSIENPQSYKNVYMKYQIRIKKMEELLRNEISKWNVILKNKITPEIKITLNHVETLKDFEEMIFKIDKMIKIKEEEKRNETLMNIKTQKLKK